MLLLLSRGGIAQGIPCAVTISYLLCISTRLLNVPDSATRAVWQLPADTPSNEAGETLQEMVVNFAYQISFHTCWFL
jgi:hypothetical protein